MTRSLLVAPRSAGRTVVAPAAPTAARMTGHQARVAAGLVSALLMLAFVADLRLQPGGQHVTRIVDDLTQWAAGATMSLAAFWRASHAQDRLRLSWLFIGLGGACWATGQAIWSYYEIIASVETPFPSLADAGYLLLPIFGITGLLIRPSQAFSGRGRLRVALDILLVLVSLFTVSWATAFGEVYRGGGSSTFARLVSLAYPAGDIALLTLVVVVLAYAHAGSRAGLLCLGSGLAVFAIADSGFAYLTAKGTYITGNLIDACWVAGFGIMAWAAVVDRSGGKQRQSAGSYITVLLPCVPTLVGLVFALLRLGPSGADTLLLAASAIMVVVLLIRQIVVVADNYRLMERMRYQAFHDPLTGLSNRSLFNDRLAHALDLHRRDRRRVAVLLIDLDNFKLVNDSLGHTAGDELLVRVSERLLAAVRRGDTVARLGGDEFAILVEDSGDAEEIAARVLANLADAMPVGDRQVAARASIGICELVTPEVTPTSTEMLQRADIAMYAAKRAGKGMVRAYSAEMAQVASGQLEMQAALLADLAAGRIDVAYQPIFPGPGERPVAVEALARWTYDGAAVPPEVFLTVARDLGCINVLDEIVVRAAASTVAPLGALSLAVNLDRRTLAQPGFAARMREMLDATGLPADRLIVEVLEFDLVERDQEAVQSLAALRGLGAKVSVDDFGAGYATLARLNALRPDVLKIDRSLVVGTADPTVASLLAGAAQLGRHIGAQVVAEGIETRAQLRAAVAAGCDGLQGFYLCRPLAAEPLRRLIAANLAAQG